MNGVSRRCKGFSIVILCFLFNYFVIKSQPGELFCPSMKGKTLEGKKIRFFQDLKKKCAVLIIGFDRHGDLFIESWHKPLVNHYTIPNDIDYYIIPLISSWYSPLSSVFEIFLKKLIPSNLHRYVLPCYVSVNSYQKKLCMPSTVLGCILVIDNQGKIYYSSSQKAQDKELKKCFAIIDKIKYAT